MGVLAQGFSFHREPWFCQAAPVPLVLDLGPPTGSCSVPRMLWRPEVSVLWTETSWPMTQ